MIGRFYIFERVSMNNVASCSWTAREILRSAARNIAGIRFHELTDRTNPRPFFVVIFANEVIRNYFEGMIKRLIENSGLRIELAQPDQQVAPAD